MSTGEYNDDDDVDIVAKYDYRRHTQHSHVLAYANACVHITHTHARNTRDTRS